MEDGERRENRARWYVSGEVEMVMGYRALVCCWGAARELGRAGHAAGPVESGKPVEEGCENWCP